MGRVMILRRFRIIGPALALAVAAASGAGAQSLPPPNPGAPGAPPPGVAAPPGVAVQPPQPQNPVCARLEAQLAALDRDGRGEQIQRYENALQAQQSELDRTVAQARRTGCEGSGFFLFGRSQPPQCDELNNRVQRMRANLDRLNADLQHLQAGRGAVEGQRRQILAALGQNDCGPQYRSAAAAPEPARPRGVFEALFGGGGGGGGGSPGGSMSAPFGSGDMTPSDQSSTYRTICVRTCDGFYFPVSYSAGQAKFRDDEQTCQRVCPAAEVMLFTYRNPGEDVAQAVSISGQPYTSLPNAFRYRQEFNPACSCRRQGESWAETLKSVEDPVERGDIVVTDENAKALTQPKADARATKQNPPARKGQAPPAAADAAATPAPVTVTPLPDPATPAPQPPPAAAATPSADQGKRSVRTIGPPFIAR